MDWVMVLKKVGEVCTCKDFNISTTSQVSELDYERETKTFTMRLCRGDDWLARVRSTLGVAPASVVFGQDDCQIQMETYADVTKLGAWLIATHQECKDSYRGRS